MKELISHMLLRATWQLIQYCFKVTRWSASVIKGGVAYMDIHVSRYLIEELGINGFGLFPRLEFHIETPLSKSKYSLCIWTAFLL